MFLKFILSLILIYQTICVISIETNDVKTSSGVIRGKTFNILNHTIDEYLGIPYAEPPVGKLRFSKTRSLQKPIDGIYDATVVRNSCMQAPFSQNLGFNANLTFNEDCLTLNIWSPKVKNGSALKPVMFWIHGGGFIQGSIYQLPWYNGSFLAAHDVVLVDANYRLGPLGFLYGGTDDSPGNLGLYDQLEALKWVFNNYFLLFIGGKVRENIHLFGGDRNQITIFGGSAGSYSTSAHILSPLSRGLFKRAIMQSGGHFSASSRDVMSISQALQQSKAMAKFFNCTDDNKWLDCLRGVDIKTLMTYPVTAITGFCLDETEFLPTFSVNAFKNQSYNRDIDLIAGIVRDEGSLLAYWVFPQLRGNFTLKDFKDLITLMLMNVPEIKPQIVIDHYLKNIKTNSTNAVRKAFYDFYGDATMKCPTYLFAKTFAKNTPKQRTYFYESTYQSTTSILLGCDEKTMGICHGSEVEFTFGTPLNFVNSSQIDINYSLDIMKLWTDFVKTGKPESNWPQMIHHGSNLVKDLNPHKSISILIDPFKYVCEELFKI